MNRTIQEKNKALALRPSIHCSTSGTMSRPQEPATTLKYEPGTIVAEGDHVIVRGRFSGFGQPVNWIAADIVRINDGVLVEHWDVIQDAATRGQSKSEPPMFGDNLATQP
jgi:predicted SnoaL-like aldol condensation-catalyzing enzyme